MKLKKLQAFLRSKKLLAIPLFVLFTFIGSLIPVNAAFDLRCEDANEVYVDGSGCVVPKVKFTQEVYAADTDKVSLGSSVLGGEQIDTLKISNPWAAQGQPVIVKFTLENIGNQFPYPYNVIDLPPDNYVLMMGVDKDIGVRTPDGKFVDIWSFMTIWEKFIFLMGTSSAEFFELAKNTLQGQTCGYVDASKYMSERVKDYVQKQTNSRTVMSWHCLKIVDKPFFATEIKQYCRGEIDAECISNMNADMGNSVNDVVTVLLTDTEDNQIPKGQCVRPHQGIGFWGWMERLLLPQIKWNIVKCSIGDDGLKPGQKVTFDFVIAVPKDTPVVNPRYFEDLEIYRSESNELYTFSNTCKDDPNAVACHSIYASVWPAKTDNWLSLLKDSWTNSFKLGSCTVTGILSSAQISLCVETHGYGAEAVGEPIWEGAGVFYVIGPILKGSIELLLWAAVVAGGLTGFGLGPGKT